MDNISRVHGLILAGGRSRRMGEDKATLRWGDDGQFQWKRMVEMLRPLCDDLLISVREDQELSGYEDGDPGLLVDSVGGGGPLAGILSAFGRNQSVAWFVVACDLPLLSLDECRRLLELRSGEGATAYRSSHDGLPEPLCAVYEPDFLDVLQRFFDEGLRCPRKILIRSEDRVKLVELSRPEALDNANTPEDRERIQKVLRERVETLTSFATKE